MHKMLLRNHMLRVLEDFGNCYVEDEEYLGMWNRKRNVLKNDWFQALDFFLSRVYFQGRGDELSEHYYERAREVLLAYFGKDPSTQIKRYNIAWNKGVIPHDPDWKVWTENDNRLWKELEKAKAGKFRDIEMVLDILRFIHSCPSKNIVLYSIKEIKNGRINELYLELDSIWQVGQKVASFYLRDLVLLYELELSSKNYFTTQPVDTWVYQVANRLGICSDEDSLFYNVQGIRVRGL